MSVVADRTDAERQRDAQAVLFRPDTFAFACTRTLVPEARFMLPPHIRYIAGKVVDAIVSRPTKLTIEATVRHGKSHLCSRWLPPWYLGCFPDHRVILVSYEADFAATWGGDARDILQEHGHLYGVRVDQSTSAKDEWNILGTQGGMITAGIGGAITGRGADLLLIDDPFKNADEANSQTIRDKRWEWIQSTALTRLQPGAVVIVTQARWHEDDLIGRLHNPEYTPPGTWDRIRLPALAEENDPLGREIGEALWPEMYSRADLEAIRAERGPRWFGALYMQNPMPIGSGIFRAEDFRTWNRPDDENGVKGRYYELRRDDGTVDRFEISRCTRFQTWDLAVSTKTTADYTVCSTWALTAKRDLLLINVMRRRMEGPDIKAAMHAQYAAFLPAFVGIEGNGTQLTFVQQAQREGLPTKKLMPDKDKTSRGISASTLYEAHKVFHPPAPDAPWLGDFEQELLAFDKGAHDDQVDTVSYACWYAQQGTMSTTWRDALERQAGVSPERALAGMSPTLSERAGSFFDQSDGFFGDD